MYLFIRSNECFISPTERGIPHVQPHEPRTGASSSDSLARDRVTDRVLRRPRSVPSLPGHSIPFLWLEAERVMMFTSWICDVIDPSGACGHLSIRPRCPVSQADFSEALVEAGPPLPTAPSADCALRLAPPGLATPLQLDCAEASPWRPMQLGTRRFCGMSLHFEFQHF